MKQAILKFLSVVLVALMLSGTIALAENSETHSEYQLRIQEMDEVVADVQSDDNQFYTLVEIGVLVCILISAYGIHKMDKIEAAQQKDQSHL